LNFVVIWTFGFNRQKSIAFSEAAHGDVAIRTMLGI
jgi:hypothetical protein